MKRIVSVLCVFVGIAQISAQENALDKVVDSFRVKFNVPAVVASVIKYDTVLYGISGYKNMDSKDPIDLNSKFHLASNTKAITATIAAKMVEEGKLKWDSKLIEIVPELENTIRNEYKNITLEDLLSNRAKIQPFEDDSSKEWRNIPRTISRSENQKFEFAKYALSIKSAKLKDENHVYSNGGFIIAGLILEKVSGKSWNKLTQELFGELGLDIYNGFPSQEKTNGTSGHKKRGKLYQVVKANQEYPLGKYFGPAGNTSMNLLDLSKFIQLHLRGLMGDQNVLTHKTYQKLHYGLPKYSLGWYNGYIGDTKERFSYHGGSLGTFSSAIMLSADRKVAIVILVNSDDKKTNELKNELRKKLWKRYGS